MSRASLSLWLRSPFGDYIHATHALRIVPHHESGWSIHAIFPDGCGPLWRATLAQAKRIGDLHVRNGTVPKRDC